MKGIRTLKNINTRRNLLSACLVGFSITNDDKNQKVFNTELKKLNELKNKQLQSGEMTSREKDKYVPWKDFLKLRRVLAREVNFSRLYDRQKLNKTDFIKLQRYLLVQLFTNLPPQRNDYSDVQVMTEKKYQETKNKNSLNVLVTARGGYKFYFGDYKTRKTYGIRALSVKEHSKALQRILKKHITYMKRFFPDNHWLLLNNKYQKLTRNALTKMLQRLFKQYFHKNVSSTAIRSSFLTHRYNKAELEKNQQLATDMGHSFDVARKFYVKKAD